MQHIPDLQYLVRKGREGTAIDPLDPHLQHAVVQTGANGIVAAQLGPVEILSECQILTLLEGKRLRVFGLQGQDHRVADGAVNISH